MIASVLKTYGIVILAAVGIALFVRQNIFEAYRLPTSTMLPTLQAGDTIFVSKLAYRVASPARGDVVIYQMSLPVKGEFVKRIVGLPGEAVSIEHGKLTVNGIVPAFLPESTDAHCGTERWTSGESVQICVEDPAMPDFSKHTLANDEFFVISDLRADRSDNSALKPYGIIKRESLIGRAKWIWFSAKTSRIFKKIE